MGVLRTMLNTNAGAYAGIYIMASNDLNTWQLITGKQRTGDSLHDLVVQRYMGV